MAPRLLSGLLATAILSSPAPAFDPWGVVDQALDIKREQQYQEEHQLLMEERREMMEEEKKDRQLRRQREAAQEAREQTRFEREMGLPPTPAPQAVDPSGEAREREARAAARAAERLKAQQGDE